MCVSVCAYMLVSVYGYETAGGSVFFCRLVFKIVEFINIDNLSSGLGDWECVCLCESAYRHLHVSVFFCMCSCACLVITPRRSTATSLLPIIPCPGIDLWMLILIGADRQVDSGVTVDVRSLRTPLSYAKLWVEENLLSSFEFTTHLSLLFPSLHFS